MSTTDSLIKKISHSKEIGALNCTNSSLGVSRTFTLENLSDEETILGQDLPFGSNFFINNETFLPTLQIGITYPTSTNTKTTFKGEVRIKFIELFNSEEEECYTLTYQFSNFPVGNLVSGLSQPYLVLPSEYGTQTLSENYSVKNEDLFDYYKNQKPIQIILRQVQANYSAQGNVKVNNVKFLTEVETPPPIYGPSEIRLRGTDNCNDVTKLYENIEIAPTESFSIYFSASDSDQEENRIKQYNIYVINELNERLDLGFFDRQNISQDEGEEPEPPELEQPDPILPVSIFNMYEIQGEVAKTAVEEPEEEPEEEKPENPEVEPDQPENPELSFSDLQEYDFSFQSLTPDIQSKFQKGIYTLKIEAIDQYGNIAIGSGSPIITIEASLCQSFEITSFSNSLVDPVMLNNFYIGDSNRPDSYELEWESTNGTNNQIISYKILWRKKEEEEEWEVLKEEISANEKYYKISSEELSGIFPISKGEGGSEEISPDVELKIVAIHKYPVNGEIEKSSNNFIYLSDASKLNNAPLTANDFKAPEAIIKDLTITWDSFNEILPQGIELTYNLTYRYYDETTSEYKGETTIKGISKNSCTLSYDDCFKNKDFSERKIELILQRVLTVGHDSSCSIKTISLNGPHQGLHQVGQYIEGIPELSFSTDNSSSSSDLSSYFYNILKITIEPPKLTNPQTDLNAILQYRIGETGKYSKYQEYQIYNQLSNKYNNPEVNFENIIKNISSGTTISFQVIYYNKYGQEFKGTETKITKMPEPKLLAEPSLSIDSTELSLNLSAETLVTNDILNYQITLYYIKNELEQYSKTVSGSFSFDDDSSDDIPPKILTEITETINFDLNSENDKFFGALYSKAIGDKTPIFPGKLIFTISSNAIPACQIKKEINFEYNFITKPSGYAALDIINAKQEGYFNPEDQIKFSITPVQWADAAGSTKGADISYRIISSNNKIIEVTDINDTTDTINEALTDLTIMYKLVTRISYKDYYQEYSTAPQSIAIARWAADPIQLLPFVQKGETLVSSFIIPYKACSSLIYSNLENFTCKLWKDDELLEDHCYVEVAGVTAEKFLEDYTFENSAFKNEGESLVQKIICKFATLPTSAVFKLVATFINTSGKTIEVTSNEYSFGNNDTTIAIRKGKIGINVPDSFNPEKNKETVLINAADDGPALKLNIQGSATTENNTETGTEYLGTTYIAFSKNNSPDNVDRLYYSKSDGKNYFDNFYYPVTSVNGEIGDITINAGSIGARPESWIPTLKEVWGKKDVENTWKPTAFDVGARPNDWMPTIKDVWENTEKQKPTEPDPNLDPTKRPIYWLPTAEDVSARPSDWVPTLKDIWRKENVENDWKPTADDVGARPNDWFPTTEDIGALKIINKTNFSNENDFAIIYKQLPKNSIFVENAEDFLETLNLSEESGIIIVLTNYNNDKIIKFISSSGKEFLGDFINDRFSWYLTNNKNAINELDNSYFPEIINQKQIDGYYFLTSGQYAYDRWVAAPGCEGIVVKQGNNSLIIENNTNALVPRLQQYLVKDFTNKSATMAIKTKNGEIYSYYIKSITQDEQNPKKTIYNENEQPILNFGINFESTITITQENGTIQETDGRNLYYFYLELPNIENVSTNSIELEWVALYEGIFYQAPEYIPKGYLNELKECQKYFYCFIREEIPYLTSGYGLTNTSFRAIINTPVPMRVQPSLNSYEIEENGEKQIKEIEITQVIGQGQSRGPFSGIGGKIIVQNFNNTERFSIDYEQNRGGDAIVTKYQEYVIAIKNLILDSNL